MRKEIIRKCCLKSNNLQSSSDEEHQDVFWKSNFEAMNLLQIADWNKKVKNYKLKT